MQCPGILMRLTLEHGMTSLGVEYDKGTVERGKKKKKSPTPIEEGYEDENNKAMERADSTDDDGGDPKSSSSSSSVWGFAKFMANGVKQTIVQVVNKMEEMVDDGGELMHPKDPRPLCPEENQAILLMQSFCPRQSTPDPLVGTALAQGFSRCLPAKAPPVLTRSGVVPGDQARLPYKGMEAFCKQGVVRTIVYQNAEEYHNVIAQCQKLNLHDLSTTLSQDVLEEPQLVRFLKWWVRFCKIHHNTQHNNHIIISNAQGVDIKEKIRFFMDYKQDGDETLPVFPLGDFLFYLDKDKIRTGSGFSIDALPMPDSILPKAIQDMVSLRMLSDPIFQVTFFRI
jgi:hypothetical protein